MDFNSMTRQDIEKAATSIVNEESLYLPPGAGIVVIICAPHDKKTFSLATNLAHKDLTAVLTKAMYSKK